MTNFRLKYRALLVREQEAWQRLGEGRNGHSLDPAFLAEWLVASRACSAVRNDFIDLGEYNSRQHAMRISFEALRADVQAVVRSTLGAPQRGDESDLRVCIHDQRAGVYTCLSAQSFAELGRLTVSLADSGGALGDTRPVGCECEFVFDPIN